jgi:sorbitol-specific phosphotransferase system component IIA
LEDKIVIIFNNKKTAELEKYKKEEQ